MTQYSALSTQHPVYDDSYIEHWGEVYRARPVLRRYCTFEQFIVRPHWYVENIGRAVLIAQRIVQQQIDAQYRKWRPA
jgi:hypothetical protein